MDPERLAALEEQREIISKAISEFVRLASQADDPFVTGWVIGVEWTNVGMEQAQQAARNAIAPNSQMVSASQGLGLFVVDSFRPGHTVVVE